LLHQEANKEKEKNFLLDDETLPATRKLTWLLNSVNVRTRSAVCATMRQMLIVVIIFPTKSRNCGNTKYTIAIARKQMMLSTWHRGSTILAIKISVLLQSVEAFGVQTCEKVDSLSPSKTA